MSHDPNYDEYVAFSNACATLRASMQEIHRIRSNHGLAGEHSSDSLLEHLSTCECKEMDR